MRGRMPVICSLKKELHVDLMVNEYWKELSANTYISLCSLVRAAFETLVDLLPGWYLLVSNCFCHF